MSRRKQNLIGLTARLPWWMSLPLTFSHSMQPALSRAFTLAGYGLAGACAMGALAGVAVRAKQKRLYQSQRTLDQICALSWADFEHRWPRRSGGRAIPPVSLRQGRWWRRHPSEEGWGADARSVQAMASPAGRRGAVRELAGVVAAAGAKEETFVCFGSYTPEAEAFAKRATIRLVDGNSLASMLSLEALGREEAATERCPSVGVNWCAE